MTTVYLTNQWNRPIESEFEFELLKFPVGSTVEVSEAAARHIFGYQDDDKEHYMARLGIVKTRNEISEGLKILEKILITTEPPKQNHLLSPVVDEFPSQSSGEKSLKKGRGKLRTVR